MKRYQIAVTIQESFALEKACSVLSLECFIFLLLIYVFEAFGVVAVILRI